MDDQLARSQPRGDEIDLREEHLLALPLAQCPACGARDLEPVVDEGRVNFLCGACHRCWHVELGYVHRVDPIGCGGCPARPECTAAYRADHDAGHGAASRN